ncbi:MAG TPA: amidophosphoribosyltransferase, partial [Microbacterium sp.]|nr:amidophosphoribosyltransferase [Microbacterium sp.]
LNVLASELQATTSPVDLDADRIFKAVARTHKRIQGAYAVISFIAGYGLLAFRDPFGIRPLILGRRTAADGESEWVVASESLVLENGDYEIVREVAPGEAVFITNDGTMFSQQCAENPILAPCSFEYVYLARPDSVMNGQSVYETRLRMGEKLAATIAKHIPADEIDVVMPIPDSSRPAAMEVARVLGIEYREGFYKNRYVGRTFIMPGQETRKKSVRQKLNAMSMEFRGKKVLLIDDSIVRGTTSRQIIQMARDAGAESVSFASAAPPVRFPHVYGINMPSATELIAHGRTIPEIRDELGADHLVYQEIDDLRDAIVEGSTASGIAIDDLDLSCFDGRYVTGTVSEEYLEWVAATLGS